MDLMSFLSSSGLLTRVVTADSLGSGGLIEVEASWLESASSAHSSALTSDDIDSALLPFSTCLSTNVLVRTRLSSSPPPPRLHKDAVFFFLLSCEESTWQVASARHWGQLWFTYVREKTQTNHLVQGGTEPTTFFTSQLPIRIQFPLQEKGGIRAVCDITKHWCVSFCFLISDDCFFEGFFSRHWTFTSVKHWTQPLLLGRFRELHDTHEFPEHFSLRFTPGVLHVSWGEPTTSLYALGGFPPHWESTIWMSQENSG